MSQDYSKYASQSNKKRDDELIKKKVDAIVNGKVSDKKPSGFSRMKDEIIKSDLSSISSAVMTEIVIPKMTDLFFNALESGLHMLFYGNLGSSRTTVSQGPKRDYTAYSRNTVSTVRSSSRSSEVSIDYRDVIVTDANEARLLVMNIENILDTHGEVSVADLYAMADIKKYDTIYNNYGWRSMKPRPIIKVRDGWMVKMPPLERL